MSASDWSGVPDDDRSIRTRRAILTGGALGAGALGAALAAPSAPRAQVGLPDDRYVWRSRIPLNVKDYGAQGDGTTDDRAAVQSAIDAAVAMGGGTVFFPPGSYVIDDVIVGIERVGLKIPPEKPIRLLGSGMALNSNGSSPFPTRLIRRAGNSGTLLSATGSGTSRVWLEISDIEFRGSGTSGVLVDVRIGNTVQFHSVRFVGANDSGLRMGNVYNASGSHLRWQACGAGAAAPACLFYGVSTAAGGSDTVQWNDLQFEGNGGTDLKLTGNLTNDAGTVTSEVQMSQVKMEGGTAGAVNCPYIDLDYSQNCKFSNIAIGVHGGRTVPPLRKSHPFGGTRADVFVNLTIDKVGTATMAHGIDHVRAALQLENVTILGAATAAIRVRSTVAPGDFQLGKLVTNAQRAILDERTALPAVASAATITPPRERLVSVTGTTDISSITPHEGGYVMALTFAGVLKIVDGAGNLRLAGDFTTTGGDVLTLVSDGTNWYEVARSVN